MGTLTLMSGGTVTVMLPEPLALRLVAMDRGDDGVVFDGSDDTALQVSKGGAFIRQPPRALHLEAGEAGSVTFAGDLTVRTNERTGKLASVKFGPGLFDIKLTPQPGGYRIEALLQGPLQA